MAELASEINIVVKVDIKIPLWDAIKMRMAGTYLGNYINKVLKDQLEEEIKEVELG